jgi:hypothetical protein
MSLKNFLKQSYNLSYSKNSFFTKTHEENVAKLLEKNGFTNLSKAPVLQTLSKINLSKTPLSQINLSNYKYQPNGSQKPPDFKINYCDSMINIECKSSKLKTPMWNCSLPNKDTIYIFSTPKSNILFFGDWICNDHIKEITNKFIDTVKNNVIDYNFELSTLQSTYKWSVSFRKMFNQKTIFDDQKQSELKEKMEKYIQSLFV